MRERPSSKKILTERSKDAFWWRGNWPTITAIAGTVLLVIATVMQVIAVPKSSEEKIRLQRSQLVVDLFENDRDQWQIALSQEVSKEKRDGPVLIFFADQAVVSTARWRAALEQRVSTTHAEYSKAISDRDALISEAERLDNANDLDGLMKLYAGLKNWIVSHDEIYGSDQKFSSQTDEAERSDTDLASWIAILYSVGSVLMLLSTVATSALADKKFDLILRQLR